MQRTERTISDEESAPSFEGVDGTGTGRSPTVRTPWGDAGTLRERKLRPGQRLPPEEVARNQRERLFAALVAVVAEKGYEATRVADLLDLSGYRGAPSTSTSATRKTAYWPRSMRSSARPSAPSPA